MMSYQPAAISVELDDDTPPSVAAAAAAAAGNASVYRPSVAVDCDGDDDSTDDDVEVGGALTPQPPRVRLSPSPVDLLRALPAASMSADDVTNPLRPAPTSWLLSPPPPRCRTCDIERRWRARVATVPVAAGGATCTCPGWMSTKPPAQHGPSFPAPPPAPRRSPTFTTRSRISRLNDDACSTFISGNIDVESVPTHCFNCFRLCCFRSSRLSASEREATLRSTTATTDLTTVCRCSAVVDTGNGNRNNADNGRRQRHATHLVTACIVALPVTCLALLGLTLMMHQSITGTSSAHVRQASLPATVMSGYLCQIQYNVSSAAR